MSGVNIWHNEETPGYNKSKRHTAFSKWRVLVMERLGQLNGQGEDAAVQRMHAYGLTQLGVDYDNNVTAEELAAKLAA